MTNCANLLAARLRSFEAPSQQPPEQVRGFESPHDLDAWRRHADDCELIKSVDYTLQGMDAVGIGVDMFMTALPRWYAGVNFASIPWGVTTQGNGMREACSEGDINLLEAFALTIKTAGHVVLTEDDRRTLSDVLAQAQDLIESDSTDLPADVRQYLWTLIIKAQMIVDNLDMYGHEAVRQVALELGGAMTMQAERAEQHGQPERASRWRAAALTLMGGFMGGAASGATEVAAAEVMKQITGG